MNITSTPLTFAEAEQFIGHPLEEAIFASALKIQCFVLVQGKAHPDFLPVPTFAVFNSFELLLETDNVAEAVTFCTQLLPVKNAILLK